MGADSLRNFPPPVNLRLPGHFRKESNDKDDECLRLPSVNIRVIRGSALVARLCFAGRSDRGQAYFLNAKS